MPASGDRPPMGTTSLSDLEAMLNVNVKAVFWLTQGLLPCLQNGARIVNLSSIAGRLGTAGGRSVYGATKAAVDAFTRNWALELAPRGILVNAVAPGYVETDMTTAFFAERRSAATSRREKPARAVRECGRSRGYCFVLMLGWRAVDYGPVAECERRVLDLGSGTLSSVSKS